MLKGLNVKFLKEEDLGIIPVSAALDPQQCGSHSEALRDAM